MNGLVKVDLSRGQAVKSQVVELSPFASLHPHTPITLDGLGEHSSLPACQGGRHMFFVHILLKIRPLAITLTSFHVYFYTDEFPYPTLCRIIL